MQSPGSKNNSKKRAEKGPAQRLRPVSYTHLDVYKRQVENICILCGHYEGVDQRLLDEFIDEEISIGDYVLTGGEIPAMVFADALSRMVPGVLSNNECFTEESHFNGLLEYCLLYTSY